MITVVVSPITAPSGTTVCISVTGCTTVPTVVASLGSRDFVPRIVGSDGSYTICVTLPPHVVGRLSFQILAGTDRAYTSVGIQ